MTRRRFFAPESAFDIQRSSVLLTADEARHLHDVLRLKPGNEAFVFDGHGKEFRCTIRRVKRDEAGLDIVEEVSPARPESPLFLSLGIALLKGDKFDLVVQKATELGVMRVVPVVTRFADVQLRHEGDAGKRVTRWQRIALEAAKQSGRAVVPKVASPISFAALISISPTADHLMFSEREGLSLTEVLRNRSAVRNVLALVGSEGGWSDEELGLAKEHSWAIVTLGGRILRAETAAISVAVMLQHRLGDLK